MKRIMSNEVPNKEKYKASMFNEYLDEIGKKWILYNNFSGAMVELDENIYNKLKENRFSKIDNSKVIDTLLYGKFIVDNLEDELANIKRIKDNMAESVAVIGMQIIPTLACNFQCTYCYQSERHKNVKISEAVIKAVIEYITNKIKPTTQFLNILWFGGEPLLAIDSIDRLSKAFIEIANEKKIQYFFGLISNGYLLNENNIDILLKNHIKYCQITVDGLEEVHDNRRMLKGGGKTWNTIMKNIHDAISKGIKINVRVNIDQTNVSGLEDFFRELERREIIDKIDLTIGRVTNIGDACRSIEDKILTPAKTEEILHQKNIEDMIKKSSVEVARVMPDFIGCVAAARNSFILGPEGEIYKCTKTVGIEKEECGNIFKLNLQNPNFKKWLDISNLDVEKCRKCSMSPICHGPGCLYHFLFDNVDISSCEKEKVHNNYIERLRNLYTQKKAVQSKTK